MAIKLVDGMNQPVACNKKAVKDALERTDLVQDSEECISLSHFYAGTLGDDEIDVYDSRQVYDPQEIFEVSEINEAVDRFLELIDQIS
jgi:hypothetical protein